MCFGDHLVDFCFWNTAAQEERSSSGDEREAISIHESSHRIHLPSIIRIFWKHRLSGNPQVRALHSLKRPMSSQPLWEQGGGIYVSHPSANRCAEGADETGKPGVSGVIPGEGGEKRLVVVHHAEIPVDREEHSTWSEDLADLIQKAIEIFYS